MQKFQIISLSLIILILCACFYVLGGVNSTNKGIDLCNDWWMEQDLCQKCFDDLNKDVKEEIKMPHLNKTLLDEFFKNKEK